MRQGVSSQVQVGAGSGARFFTVSDAAFFPGTVALLNSLRIVGHEEELSVLDLGLRPDQRARLAEHALVHDAPPDVAALPTLAKPYPLELGARGTLVLLDSDLVVVHRLDEPLAAAGAGAVVLLDDEHPYSNYKTPRDRWFAEWQQAFGLPAPPRRQPFWNTGFVAFATEHWPNLLPSWARACRADSRWGTSMIERSSAARAAALFGVALLLEERPRRCTTASRSSTASAASSSRASLSKCVGRTRT